MCRLIVSRFDLHALQLSHFIPFKILLTRAVNLKNLSFDWNEALWDAKPCKFMVEIFRVGLQANGLLKPNATSKCLLESLWILIMKVFYEVILMYWFWAIMRSLIWVVFISNFKNSLNRTWMFIIEHFQFRRIKLNIWWYIKKMGICKQYRVNVYIT